MKKKKKNRFTTVSPCSESGLENVPLTKLIKCRPVVIPKTSMDVVAQGIGNIEEYTSLDIQTGRDGEDS